MGLFVQASTDPHGSSTEVVQFDFRTLAPREIRDTNGNLSAASFDILGLATATAVMGKGQEADNLDGFDEISANPSSDALERFFTGTAFDMT